MSKTELSEKSRQILSDINPCMTYTKEACEEALIVIRSLQEKLSSFENEYGYEHTANDVLLEKITVLDKALEIISRVEAGMYGESTQRTELRDFLKSQENKGSAW